MQSHRLQSPLIALFLFGGALSAAAFTPGTDHQLMNATLGVIRLDIHSSHDKDITHFDLNPGYSVGFNGVFLHLRVRLPTGKVLSLTEQEIAAAMRSDFLKCS